MKMSALFKKTLLVMVLIFAIIAAATTLYSGWNLNNSLSNEYQSKGMAIAKSIADSSVEVLMNRDSSMAQSMIDQFLEIRGVKYIFIIDGDGEIISHTFVPQVPAEAAKLGSSGKELTIRELEIKGLGSIMDVSSPILAGVAGTVHVGMDRGLIRAAILSAIVRTALHYGRGFRDQHSSRVCVHQEDIPAPERLERIRDETRSKRLHRAAECALVGRNRPPGEHDAGHGAGFEQVLRGT